MYEAEDGKLFDTEQAMQEYEATSRYASHVDEYVADRNIGGDMAERPAKSAQTRVKKIVLDYLAWRTGKAAAA
jgi:hypothetical protein